MVCAFVGGMEEGCGGSDVLTHGLVTVTVSRRALCYVVADANLEPYSGNARLCVIGVDHVNNPRTT